MERSYKHGTPIKYVDPHGVTHDGLVTQWWGLDESTGQKMAVYGDGELGCNLVYASGDSAKRDPYGRQLERATSVVHKSKQPAAGNYWIWPDE